MGATECGRVSASCSWDPSKTHLAVGMVYGHAGHLDHAMAHYRDAIQYQEKEGDKHGASVTRFNVAETLAAAGRPQDALEYAQAALRGFGTYGESAADDIQDARQLIERLEKTPE